MASSTTNHDARSLNAFINQGLNGMSNASAYVLRRGGTVLAPTVLGYMGGWLTGAGSHVGFFQGAASGGYHVVVHSPVSAYIERNKGKGPYDIQPDTAQFLKIIGTIAGVCVPILLTNYFGKTAMEKGMAFLAPDGAIRWLIESKPTRQYTWLLGLAVNIAPALAQYWISLWREEDQANKKAK